MPRRMAPISQHGTDGAEADDAQRAARQFVADEMLLAGFHLLVQRLVVAVQAIDEIQIAGSHVARAHQHAGDDQFLDRIGVGAGGVEHDHAALAHGLDRDVVGAGAGAADGQHAGGIGISCMTCERTRMASGSARSLPTRNFPASGPDPSWRWRSASEFAGFMPCQFLRVQISISRMKAKICNLGRHPAGREGAELQPCDFSNSFIQSTSACTPSTGMAL
jgi:hypothetical protein